MSGEGGSGAPEDADPRRAAHARRVCALQPSELAALLQDDGCGFFVRSGVFGDVVTHCLREAIGAYFDSGGSKQAGMRGGVTAQEYRGDEHVWVSSCPSLRGHFAMRAVVEYAALLRSCLAARAPWLGLRGGAMSAQATLYDGTRSAPKRYVRHMDVGAEVPRASPRRPSEREARRVTLLLYLNPDWAPSSGGQLRVFHGSGGDERHFDVPPRMDQVVVFRRWVSRG